MGHGVGGVVELRGVFVVDGEDTDPTDVTLTIRAPDGTVTNPEPTRTGVGTYEYLLTTDQAGRWTWEFVGTGAASDVLMGGLTVVPGVADGSPTLLASLTDVEEALLGRTLTEAESARVEALIDQLIATLELKLNRWLYPRTVTETHSLAPGGRLVLHRGPVRSVTSILIDGVATADPLALVAWERAGFVEDTEIVVTYTAGEDPDPAVRGVIVDAIARTVLAGVAAGAGTIKSYSVEGTSITYGDVADGGQGGSGRLKVGDIRAIGRKRRPVLLT